MQATWNACKCLKSSARLLGFTFARQWRWRQARASFLTGRVSFAPIDSPEHGLGFTDGHAKKKRNPNQGPVWMAMQQFLRIAYAICKDSLTGFRKELPCLLGRICKLHTCQPLGCLLEEAQLLWKPSLVRANLACSDCGFLGDA